MADFPGFIGQGYTARALAFDAQRAMNLYLEADESGTGKFPRALFGTPGLKLLETLPTSPVRGIWTGLIDNLPGSSGTDLCYVVAGSKLYQVAQSGAALYATLLGDVGTDATNSPCQFQVNGSQLLVSSAGFLWVWTNSVLSQVFFNNGTGTVDTAATAVSWVSGDVFDASQVGSYILIAGTAYLISAFVDELHVTLSSSAGTQSGATFYVLTGATSTPVYVSAAQIAFLDTYFIALPPGSKQYFISAINDGLNWNPLDFGVKAAFPDNIAAILADHEELWLFGSEASEVDQDTGGSAVSTFPFARNPGAIISQGCRAPFSAVSVNNGLAWIGGTTQGGPVAWFAQGFSPQRISTHAIEAAWSEYSTVTDAVAFVYVQDGHQFWVISFPTANATWVWDATAGTWHERGWWNGTSLDRARYASHGFVFGMHLVGDWQSGNLYQLSPDFFDDAGTAIHNIRTCPHLSQEELRTFYSCFRLASTSGPVPTLQWSDDYGANYNALRRGNRRRLNAANTAQFTEWRRMAYGRDRIHSLVIAPSAGTVSISGTAVTWVSGDQFTGILAGDKIAIAGTTSTVASVPNATHLVLTGSAGTQTGLVLASTVGIGTALYVASITGQPAGWQNVGFNDSGWTAPVLQTNTPGTAPAGAAWITDSVTSRNTQPHLLLLRIPFTLPVQPISASLSIFCDDWADFVYLNGSVVYSATDAGGAMPSIVTVPVSPAALVAGTNLLAIQVRDNLAFYVSAAFTLSAPVAYSSPPAQQVALTDAYLNVAGGV